VIASQSETPCLHVDWLSGSRDISQRLFKIWLEMALHRLPLNAVQCPYIDSRCDMIWRAFDITAVELVLTC
jgi:hypothetical protein